MSVFYEQVGANVEVTLPDEFNLADTLDCGQAFRWKECDGAFEGIARGKYLKVSSKDGKLIFHNTSIVIFDTVWWDYFDFERDYTEIKNVLSADETLKKAIKFAGGIRILHQDPWECICSFIISQNNNIPRIKGIIERICENFGEPIEGGYTFPTAEKIAALTSEDLAPLRAGFRTKYILDAAKKVASREVNLREMLKMPTDEARAE
ncbi:MAG: DNA glycosylase, partial [Clostridia bacterium]|nr:DNA glycosylase [Clostridia bacterium]